MIALVVMIAAAVGSHVKAPWWLPGNYAPCLCPHQLDGESCCNGPAGNMCCAGCVAANEPRRELERALRRPRARLRAWLARYRDPRCGWCRGCGRPWGRLGCEEHVVWYSDGPGGRSGAFAACVDCWPAMSLDERVAAMRRVHGSRAEWAAIKLAVRREFEVCCAG